MTDIAHASRQRVIDALNRREPDRILFDMGGSFRSSIYEVTRLHAGLK